MVDISSVKNERIKQFAKLKEKKYRDVSRQFLIEGEHLIQEALRHNLVDVLLYSKEHFFAFDGECISVTQPVLDKLCFSVSKAEYVAVCHMPVQQEQPRKRVVLLDEVQDPGNVGTIIRSAVSFGFDQVILSPDSADLYNEKVIRSTQGALFQIPIVRQDIADAIHELQSKDFVVYGTGFSEALPLAAIDSQTKMAFVMGNEGNGVHDHILQLCNGRIMIEMGGFDSLNVAVASGILMYTFRNLEENQ